jgi:hypothetical protein
MSIRKTVFTEEITVNQIVAKLGKSGGEGWADRVDLSAPVLWAEVLRCVGEG